LKSFRDWFQIRYEWIDLEKIIQQEGYDEKLIMDFSRSQLTELLIAYAKKKE